MRIHIELAYPSSNCMPSRKNLSILVSEVLSPPCTRMTSQLQVLGHNFAPHLFQKQRLGHMVEQTLLYIFAAVTRFCFL